MRHSKKFNHLGRKTAHRHSMLSNMACSLIEHKRITTTVAKAKELRKFVEPLVTRSKDDTTHSRRMAFAHLGNKFAVTELFREVGPKVGARNGGYTRIIRTGARLGDNAEMCLIELVDFNEIYGNEVKKKRSRRSRRGGAAAAESAAVVAPAAVVADEVPAPEGVVSDVAEEAKAEAVETASEGHDSAEAPTAAEKESSEEESSKE